jgi:hypothetical protein
VASDANAPSPVAFDPANDVAKAPLLPAANGSA